MSLKAYWLWNKFISITRFKVYDICIYESQIIINNIKILLII